MFSRVTTLFQDACTKSIIMARAFVSSRRITSLQLRPNSIAPWTTMTIDVEKKLTMSLDDIVAAEK